MKIITRSMLCVMQPLVDQVELYSSFSPSSDYSNFPIPEVEDICDPLLQMKSSSLCEEIKILKISLRDFYDALDSIKKNKRCSLEEKRTFVNLVQNVYKFLKRKELLSVEDINSVLRMCDKSFLNFMTTVNLERRHSYLLDFVECMSHCLMLVKDRTRDLVVHQQRQQVLLCVRQISKCIPLVVDALRSSGLKDQAQPLHAYVQRRMGWCLQELQGAVGVPRHPGDPVPSSSGGQFVQRMDTALEFIARLGLTDGAGLTDNILSQQLKTAIDEVLCHAMSIGHVAVETDTSIIQRCCHKVLRMQQQLSDHEESPAMRTLLQGALSDALERLERHINAALLRLVLEVFSELFTPLKDLLDACECHGPVAGRHVSSLDPAVEAFDMQMDRIMQLGLFAVACSQDTRCVVGLRSCLASLESLEPELVPAVAALYLDPGHEAHRACVTALVDHWTQEVQELKTLIHGIVDPTAFCEVAVEEVIRLATSVKAAPPQSATSTLRSKVQQLVRRAVFVAQQLKRSLQDEFGSALPHELVKPTKDFYFACNELEAARQLLLSASSPEEISPDDRRRLIQRCELLVSTLRRVQNPLIGATEFSACSLKENVPPSDENCSASGSCSHKSKSSLFFPESVRDLPLDQDTISSDENGECLLKDLSALLHRGREMARERSVLYCTPRTQRPLTLQRPPISEEVETSTQFSPKKSTVDKVRPCANIFARANKQRDSKSEDTLGLEITNILENLTSLSDTLTSVKQEESEGSRNRNDSNVDKVPGSLDVLRPAEDGFAAACAAAVFSDISSTVAHTDTVCSPLSLLRSTFEATEEDTMTRLDDLRTLQERIAALKAGASPLSGKQ